MKTIEINNKHYIDANVVMLQCKDNENASPSALYLRTSTKKLYYEGHVMTADTLNQHLYITSNEEIKEGDWCVHNYGNGGIEKSKYNLKKDEDSLFEDYKKIIATTDSSLEVPIYNKLGGRTEKLKMIPQISKEFIQVFIESYNASKIIEDILVEYREDYRKTGGFKTSINNPTEWEYDYFYDLKLKDNTIIIKKKEESWDDIFNASFKDKRTTRYLLEQYLKENYHPPIKKLKQNK